MAINNYRAKAGDSKVVAVFVYISLEAQPSLPCPSMLLAIIGLNVGSA